MDATQSSQLIELAERTWSGEDQVGGHTLLGGTPLGEVADGLAMVPAFSNVMPIRTDDGLVLVDTSHEASARRIFSEVRSYCADPIHTAIYTHGHIDHVGGMGPFDAEAAERGLPRIRVVAHEATLPRFARYAETNGYNSIINQRQFGSDLLRFPSEFREPDETFRDELVLDVGGTRIELHHARGETDDHAWVWLPERRALYPGDLFIWVVPNAGNPQKVQRYAADWADALRTMASLDAQFMLPSHGPPVVGAERVRVALEDTAELLQVLHDDTVEMMNRGSTLNEIIHTVRVPEHLAAKPYLKPLYDDPEFIIRNVWRLVGGWFDGDPSNLKPSTSAALASEIAGLAGGSEVLAKRSLELLAEGDLRLAGHLSQLAVLADPTNPDAHRARSAVYRERASSEPSLMAKGIFNATVRDSDSAAADSS